ncbi:transferase [Powellomyces hirtus]|nr:transferase [Powellomyces hirtus]
MLTTSTPSAAVQDTTPRSPFIKLLAPKFIHAPNKINTESHVTLSIVGTYTSLLSVPQAWFFDHQLDYDVLAEALAQVLQKHPIYAGRMVEITKEGLIKIELSNEGIPFAKGLVGGNHHLGFEDLVDSPPKAVHEPHPALDELLPASCPIMKEDFISQRAPLLSATLTTLSDGTSVIAVRFPHFLFDQTCIGFFMNDWADATRGALSFFDTDQTAAAIAAFSDPVNQVKFTGDVSVPDPKKGAAMFPAPEVLEGVGAVIMKECFVNPRTTFRTFHLPQRVLDNLKQSVRSHDERVSEHDCLCAFLWKTLASLREPGLSQYLMAVDARLRLHTPLPKAHGCVMGGVALPAKDAAAMPLHVLASQIRDAVLDPDLVSGCLGFMQAAVDRGLGGAAMIAGNLFGDGPRTPQDVLISQWTRADLYKPDFGSGAPVRFVPLCGGSNPRLANLLGVWPAPPPTSDGLMFGINLYTEEMPEFVEKIEAFLKGPGTAALDDANFVLV